MEFIKTLFDHDKIINFLNSLLIFGPIWNKISKVSDNDAVKLVATLCTVIPVILSWLGKILNLSDKKLVYCVNEVSLEGDKFCEIENININYRGEKYENLTITNIAVWNKGKVMIDSDNQVIEIWDNCKNSIVDFNCKYNSNKVRIVEQNNKIAVSFDKLMPKEGFVLQIVQKGLYSDLDVICNIHDVKLSDRSNHKIRRSIIFILALGILYFAIFLLLFTVQDFINDIFAEENIDITLYLKIIILVVLCFLGFACLSDVYRERIDPKINDVLSFKSKNLILEEDAQKIEVIRLRNTHHCEFEYKKVYKRRKINKDKCYLVYGKNKEVVEVYTVDDVLDYKRNKTNRGDDKVRVRLIKADESLRKKYLGKSVKYICPTLLDKIKIILNKI